MHLEHGKDPAPTTVNAPVVRDASREAAHNAYHAHNEECGCRTVEHLSHFIADAVVLAIAPEVNRRIRSAYDAGQEDAG